MSRTPIAALALLTLAACAPDGEEAAAEAAPATAAPATASAPATDARETGTFRIMRGDSAIVTVRFTRTPAQLESEIRGGADSDRMAYTATLAPDATVSALQARLFAPGAAEPKGQVELSFRGDSAFFQSVEGEKTQKGSTAVPAGVIPIPVSEAVAMAEQILRRARVLGGTTATVPVLSLEDGAELGTATVTFMGADSARMQFGGGSGGSGEGTEVIAATDAVGRLLGGRIPGQGFVIRRDP
jgi:hypothetical protein